MGQSTKELIQLAFSHVLNERITALGMETLCAVGLDILRMEQALQDAVGEACVPEIGHPWQHDRIFVAVL